MGNGRGTGLLGETGNRDRGPFLANVLVMRWQRVVIPRSRHAGRGRGRKHYTTIKTKRTGLMKLCSGKEKLGIVAASELFT